MGISESFKVIWKSPLWVKFVFIILFSSFFIKAFILSTTNSLYVPEIRKVLSPIYTYTFYIVITSCSLLIIYSSIKKRILEYLIVGGIIMMAIVFCVLLYGFSPCFHEHTSRFTGDVFTSPIDYTLKHSFLCPSYSNRSYLYLFIYEAIGFIIFRVSVYIKKEINMHNNAHS